MAKGFVIKQGAKPPNLKGIIAKVGLPKSSNPYPDGTSVVDVAFWNEFGTNNIPPRPFMAQTLSEHAQKYKQLLMDANKLGTEKALALVALEMAQDIQTTITEFSDPPNAQTTIDIKGSSQPLSDTGHLRQSITWEVTDEN